MSQCPEDGIVVKNIYYMMAYAFRTLDMGEYTKLRTEQFENLADLLAAILTIGISGQRRRGIEHGYQGVSEDLGGVRGRVDVWGSARLRMDGQLKVRCEFDEFTADTPMNRILKTAALTLLRRSDLDPERAIELRRAAMGLIGVGTIDNPGRIAWRMLSFHRNNASYRFLMGVCRLVFESHLLTTSSGENHLSSFLDAQTLPALYEHFVLAYFSRHHPELRPSAKVLDEPEDAPSFLPRLQTDITLQGINSTLIIDTKCYGRILKAHFDKEIFSPANRHQIVDYVVHESYGKSRPVSGMLLYARTSHEPALRESWSEVGHRFYLWTLDLGQDFSAIASELEEVSELVC